MDPRTLPPAPRLRRRDIAIGLIPLILLVPWIDRILWAHGDVRFGGLGVHSSRICGLTSPGLPADCYASFALPMTVSLAAILAAALMVLVAWRMPQARARPVAAAGAFLASSWLALLVEGATKRRLTSYEIGIDHLLLFMAQPWTLLRTVMLLGAGIFLFLAARRLRAGGASAGSGAES